MKRHESRVRLSAAVKKHNQAMAINRARVAAGLPFLLDPFAPDDAQPKSPKAKKPKAPEHHPDYEVDVLFPDVAEVIELPGSHGAQEREATVVTFDDLIG